MTDRPWILEAQDADGWRVVATFESEDAAKRELAEAQLFAIVPLRVREVEA